MIASNEGRSLPLDEISTDGGTQLRERISQTVIEDYATLMIAGVKFPPGTVFHDGEFYWLADGFTRLEAAKRAGLKELPFDIRAGSLRDAILFAAGANANHGVPRSNADKRKAVAAVLSDPDWSKKSDRWIAEVCNVSHPLVALVREQLAQVEKLPPDNEPEAREGRDGKQYPAQTTTPPLSRPHPDDEAGGDDEEGDEAEPWEETGQDAGATAAEDDGAVIDLDAPATDGRKPGPTTQELARKANGKEKIGPKQRRAAREAWGVVMRYLVDAGHADALSAEFDRITAAIDRV